MSDAAAQPTQPRISIVNQFAKFMSFDNVAAREHRNPTGRPNINVQVNSENVKLESDQHLVSLIFAIKAVADDGQVVFSVNLDYAGVARIIDATDAQKAIMLSVETPTLLFPFARRMIAEVTREGGFPPLMLDPINFAQLYGQQLANARAAASNGADSAEKVEPAEGGETTT